jgi:Arc/MetJ-type ribon-helix-helix transcriptional regulator
VWRASGPFVKEALRLVRSIDESLTNLIGQGYPLANESENVHAALVRLQAMLNTEIDEAEALQAAGEWTFVAEQAARVRGAAAPANAAESKAGRTESGATALTPGLSQGEREKEAQHDE